jgi:indolepyruvate ferredoxin oxidoreductase alpha subunit
MDVLADAEEILAELGVRYEANASEAAAAAMLAASVHYPIRGAVTFKGPVGVNVASDALANLSSSGVTGGALVIIGEDYGEGSSIMQERSHAFAMKSRCGCSTRGPTCPRSSSRCIRVRAVGSQQHAGDADGADPLLPCHRQFSGQDNKRRRFPCATRLPIRAATMPGSCCRRCPTCRNRTRSTTAGLPHRSTSARTSSTRCSARQGQVGIVLQGGMYNGVIRALQRLGLADVHGDTEIPLYVMNVTYPMVKDEFFEFCEGKEAVLVVEEGQPEFIEQALAQRCTRRAARSVARQGHDADGRRIHRPGDARRHRGVFLKNGARDAARPVRAPNSNEPAAPPDLSKTVPAARRASAPAARNGRSSRR